MLYKENWDQAKERYQAFWNRSCIDRCALRVVSKKKGVFFAQPQPADIFKKWTDIDYILDNVEAGFQATYFAAEAIPNYFPDLGPGIITAFMGSEPQFAKDTVWFTEIINDWETYQPQFDPQNKWWLKILEMTRIALERGRGKYLIGVTDFHGAGDNLLNMRGSQNLCMDFVMYPEEVKRAISYLTKVLMQCFNQTSEMILKQQDGTTHWMGIWGKGRHDVLQADVGALIGPAMFKEFFYEEFVTYINTLDRSIFHVDGPDMIRHLDLLLEIPKLDAIQWVPGDGQPEAIGWIPMLKKVQQKGKSLFVYSSAKNVEGLLRELVPEGLFIHVYDTFDEEESVDQFIKKVERWCAKS